MRGPKDTDRAPSTVHNKTLNDTSIILFMTIFKFMMYYEKYYIGLHFIKRLCKIMVTDQYRNTL